MTMLSFRLEEEQARTLELWARKLGIDRSELIRQALDRHLAALASGDEIAGWLEAPLSEAEASLAEIADWGPAEDWSDWADAEG
jgi:predicted transcriptional regulator